MRNEKTEIKLSLLLVVKTSHVQSWGISCQRLSDFSQTLLHEKVGNLVHICITEVLEQKTSSIPLHMHVAICNWMKVMLEV